MATIPQLESCCCGCSLPTGTKIIGWLHLVCSILATFMVATGLAAILYIMDHPEIDTPEARELRPILPALKIISILSILFYLASCGLAFVLLLGVYQNKAKLVIIWVVASLTMAVMETLLELLQMFYVFKANLLFNFVAFFINLYLILVVYSFYRNIRSMSTNSA